MEEVSPPCGCQAEDTRCSMECLCSRCRLVTLIVWTNQPVVTSRLLAKQPAVLKLIDWSVEDAQTLDMNQRRQSHQLTWDLPTFW